MAIAGSNRYSFQAQVVGGRLTLGKTEMAMLPCVDPVDAMPMLLGGATVRVDGIGLARVRLMKMWDKQAGGETE